jgi:gas vesicle protein
MKKHDNIHHTSNFWFGFAMGTVSLAAIAYLLGTKKGREKLKQLVEYADTVEDMPEELFAMLPTIKDMLKNTEEKVSEALPEGTSEKIADTAHDASKSLSSILEKVKTTAEEKIEQKKFFK